MSGYYDDLGTPLGSKLRTLTYEDRHHLYYYCPGCKEAHGIVVNPGKNSSGHGWDWDGNVEAPTFSPSILTSTTRRPAPGSPSDAPMEKITLCHCYVKAGRIEFLSDCPHALVGQTVDLPDFPA